MKAKTYFEQYREGLLSEDKDTQSNAICSFLTDLRNEALALTKARKASRPAAVASCYTEINQKYNAVMAFFKKESGSAPLVDDGFLILWKREIPALDTLIAMAAHQRAVRTFR